MRKIDKTEAIADILDKKYYKIDDYQREYRWGRKQIEQMIMDFYAAFDKDYKPEHDLSDAEKYGFYYMGCIICAEGTPQSIIDGQQRLTSITLLLIYLNHLQKDTGVPEDDFVDLNGMIFGKHWGRKTFNIDVPEREKCMTALYKGDGTYIPENESAQNLVDRYEDIEELFPDELKGDALVFFINWLTERVLLLKIETPSEDDAYTIFLTMNDRGLSLNSSEMLKAYIIQNVPESDRDAVNRQWQENISRIKSASSYDSSGLVNTEDVEFISIWLRAKYAGSLRDSKKGSEDQDFELLGEKFHTWVKKNAIGIMKLEKKKDFRDLVLVEMTRVTDLYLRIKELGQKMTPGYEEVFYNANRDLNYQMMFIISAVRNDDADDVINTKIKMVSKYVDDFASTRIFNYKKVNWNTNKYQLFRVMCDIRNQDCKTIGMVLVRNLRRMDVQLDGITKLRLNQFTGRYMLHILARFTSFINVSMGNPSEFDIYVDRKRKGNTYDIEHILPDDYTTYKDSFDDIDDFNESRQYIGNLLILTRDKNRSYQDMTYAKKVEHYAKDNVLAQALNDAAYHNNPKFLEIKDKYGFEAMPVFDKTGIARRADTYLMMASDIWDPNDIKKLAGGWSDEEEKDFFRDAKANEFTVAYANRSWADAVRYGFLSGGEDSTGRRLYNIHIGDLIYCHITGKGFVGIGKCISTAVHMKDFMVNVDGNKMSIDRAPWVSEEAKARLDKETELFIGIEWEKFVDNENDGYWETGLKTVPLVVYTLTDKTTYKKIQEHFKYAED